MRLLRTLLWAVLTVFLTVSLVFFMVRAAPGGPFEGEKALSAVQRTALQRAYGLDRPVLEQFTRFWGGLLRGDLGVSLALEGRPVADILAQAFPVSLGVGVVALAFAVCAGIPLGFWWALNSGRKKARPSRAIFLFSMLPSFVLAPLVQQLVLACGGVAWGYEGFRSLLLPGLVLGLYYWPFVARLTQVGFEEESRSLYLRVAQAKGLSRVAALFKHGARAALSPVLAYLGPTAAGLITGSFVVETVWGLPGLGRFFVNAVFNRDDTLLLGLVAFYTVILVAFNLAIELVLQRWNPSAKKGET